MQPPPGRERCEPAAAVSCRRRRGCRHGCRSSRTWLPRRGNVVRVKRHERSGLIRWKFLADLACGFRSVRSVSGASSHACVNTFSMIPNMILPRTTNCGTQPTPRTRQMLCPLRTYLNRVPQSIPAGSLGGDPASSVHSVTNRPRPGNILAVSGPICRNWRKITFRFWRQAQTKASPATKENRTWQ
jgi:hypothetical protein